MKQLKNLLKNLRLRQILTVFLVGVALFVSTACNSGDVRGARPDNLPVQAGGANNPHKAGGDGYTQYKMSTDPSVNRKPGDRDAADVQILSPQLIATANKPELTYPGAENGVANTRRIIDANSAQQPAEIDTAIDTTRPNGKILERVGDTFQDASAFIKDKADEADARPEFQPNPSVRN